ncbi:MAG: hypothetical protein ACRDLB_14005, partial [Actinomycetota bacterium]
MATVESRPTTLPTGFEDVLSFPLSAALFGRRARRFSMGATIPDGSLAYGSRHEPMPLTELEQLLALTAAGGNTGWHYAIIRNPAYAPYLSNYAGAAGGRTFPSAAGFHTSELFFTDDNGTYIFETRDAPALAERSTDGSLDVEEVLAAHRSRVRKLSTGRMNIPAEEPYMEGHNTWCVNRPGTTLIMPVVDLAQHAIAGLCYLLQNGVAIYDDVNDRRIPGMERFSSLIKAEEPFPLTYFDQYMLTEASVEIGTSCYAGMLMLQAMGLGGWMFDGVDRHTTLGATGDPAVPGFGFRYDADERWPIPNVTGLPGVFEGHCPPHYPDMGAAVAAFVERKYGAGGPFNRQTPGAWKESATVRGSAQVHDEEFIAAVTTMAQYM